MRKLKEFASKVGSKTNASSYGNSRRDHLQQYQEHCSDASTRHCLALQFQQQLAWNANTMHTYNSTIFPEIKSSLFETRYRIEVR